MRTKDEEVNRKISSMLKLVRYLEENGIEYAIDGPMREFIRGHPVFPDRINVLVKDVEMVPENISAEWIEISRAEFESEEYKFGKNVVKLRK